MASRCESEGHCVEAHKSADIFLAPVQIAPIAGDTKKQPGLNTRRTQTFKIRAKVTHKYVIIQRCFLWIDVYHPDVSASPWNNQVFLKTPLVLLCLTNFKTLKLNDKFQCWSTVLCHVCVCVCVSPEWNIPNEEDVYQSDQRWRQTCYICHLQSIYENETCSLVLFRNATLRLKKLDTSHFLCGHW